MGWLLIHVFSSSVVGQYNRIQCAALVRHAGQRGHGHRHRRVPQGVSVQRYTSLERNGWTALTKDRVTLLAKDLS